MRSTVSRSGADNESRSVKRYVPRSKSRALHKATIWEAMTAFIFKARSGTMSQEKSGDQ